MDDGSSPLWAVMVFLLFIIINGILYGFGSAIQKVSESEVEKRQQEGDKRSRWLLKVVNDPIMVVNTILTVGTLLSILAGYVGIREIVPHMYGA